LGGGSPPPPPPWKVAWANVKYLYTLDTQTQKNLYIRNSRGDGE
jgi:hypothetical protein